MLPRRKLGEMLMVRGLVTAEQLELGLARQRESGGRIGSLMVNMGYLAEDELLRFLSLAYDVPQIDLRKTALHPGAIKRLPAQLARDAMMVPVKIVERPPDQPAIIVATPDPTDWDSVERVRQATGCHIEPFVCSFGMFERYFDKAYRDCEDPEALALLLEKYEPQDIVSGLVKALVDKEVIFVHDLREALPAEPTAKKE